MNVLLAFSVLWLFLAVYRNLSGYFIVSQSLILEASL